jgi:small subunit ribosomal protein S21
LWFSHLTNVIRSIGFFALTKGTLPAESASIPVFFGKEVIGLTEIKLKKGEPVDKALRRLKKRIDREGTLKVVRNQRHFEKPSERRRRKEKAARFSAMLSARYADI